MEKGLSVNYFREVNVDLQGEDLRMMSPLQLAYIGDAVYELLVRTAIMSRDVNVNKLHKEATRYVKANAQAESVLKLEGLLTDEEKSFVRRGRNARINSSPKNVDLRDYKYATGFECLMGYLYLSGKDERLIELFKQIYQSDTEGGNDK
ncbi:MAG TPA: ribonuclease III domain-containing protein [Tissierellaceae bacterium]|jgi:ribonuclease-3 family protein|nr:ribonuclease III domain-containing protein [Tissierellaceae bacterium]